MAPTYNLAVQHCQRIFSCLQKLDGIERPGVIHRIDPVAKARVIRSGFEDSQRDLAVGTPKTDCRQ